MNKNLVFVLSCLLTCVCSAGLSVALFLLIVLFGYSGDILIGIVFMLSVWAWPLLGGMLWRRSPWLRDKKWPHPGAVLVVLAVFIVLSQLVYHSENSILQLPFIIIMAPVLVAFTNGSAENTPVIPILWGIMSALYPLVFTLGIHLGGKVRKGRPVKRRGDGIDQF